MNEPNRTERFFNLLGWLGFLLILPIGLHVFGVSAPLAWLGENLGRYGRPPFLILLFFGLLLLRIVFGGDRIIGPLLLGYLTGFLLLATTVEIGFMGWFRGFTDRIPFLSNIPLNFLTAVAVILLGILLSYLRRLPVILQVILLVVLPLGFLAFAHYQHLFQFRQGIELSLAAGAGLATGRPRPG